MQYTITQTRIRNNMSIILETGSFNDDKAAAIWFTDYIADMLSNDVSGKYRHESYLESKDGRFYHEPSDEVHDSLPSWWEGEGFYDEADNLILKYSYPRVSVDDDITSISLGDYRYNLAIDKESIKHHIHINPTIQAPLNMAYGKDSPLYSSIVIQLDYTNYDIDDIDDLATAIEAMKAEHEDEYSYSRIGSDLVHDMKEGNWPHDSLSDIFTPVANNMVELGVLKHDGDLIIDSDYAALLARFGVRSE